jgi:predicted ATP-binding protein involved in virulence
MHLSRLEIKNIRSIATFDLKINRANGWHVLIGDNGAGKSSIIRSIALALTGPEEALGLRADWNEWLSRNADAGSIHLTITPDAIDIDTNGSASELPLVSNIIRFNRQEGKVVLSSNAQSKRKKALDPSKYNWSSNYGWFSVAYGPYRRFAGGNPEWQTVFRSLPKLGAHLSSFGEDVALTEAVDWLVKLKFQVLEQKQEGNIIEDLKKLINSPDFLPHQSTLQEISSEGVTFKDGNGSVINVNQLSDGYRSILSLTFELIRQLVRVYGERIVFKNIRRNMMNIDVPGIVLIDEIDAHLHPTWQTRIGFWFLQYFPNLQFIVTTHSPLICRACEAGTIWRLSAPGSDQPSGEVTEKERNRLIYGNILDAYGTQVFGRNISRSEKANEKLNRLAQLNVKSRLGQITVTREKELEDLQAIFPTQSALPIHDIAQ